MRGEDEATPSPAHSRFRLRQGLWPWALGHAARKGGCREDRSPRESEARPPRRSRETGPGARAPTSSFIRVSRSFLAALKMASVFVLVTVSSDLQSA